LNNIIKSFYIQKIIVILNVARSISCKSVIIREIIWVINNNWLSDQILTEDLPVDFDLILKMQADFYGFTYIYPVENLCQEDKYFTRLNDQDLISVYYLHFFIEGSRYFVKRIKNENLF